LRFVAKIRSLLVSESNAIKWCRFCDAQHRQRFLCDPAKKVLEALLERGMRFDMPTIEFPEKIAPFPAFGGVPGDEYLEQLVVNAASIEVAGTPRPAVVFTGRGLKGPLPRWIYVADEQGIHAVSELVTKMTERAVNFSRKARFDV
jgi:hypothetical protein